MTDTYIRHTSVGQAGVHALEGEDVIHETDGKITFVMERVKGKDVLDMGCVMHNPENYKSGYWLHKAIRKVAKSVVGLDLDSKGVAFLNERGFNLIVADATDFDLGQKFDVAVAGDIIEHLNNVGNFLACAHKHLRDDGMLIVTTPTPFYWRSMLKQIMTGKVNPNPEHTCWFCWQTLKEIARRYDFEMVDLQYSTRRKGDRFVPMPKRFKYKTMSVSFKKAS